jgi:hypothetical protein
MMKIRQIEKVILVSAIVALPVFAGPRTAGPEGTQDVTTSSDLGMKSHVAAISNLSTAQIDQLRSENYGWGEIAVFGGISAKSGQSFDTILADRKSGMGWGEIAAKYNLKLGEIIKDTRADISKAEMKAEKSAKAELRSLNKAVAELNVKADVKTEHPVKAGGRSDIKGGINTNAPDILKK